VAGPTPGDVARVVAAALAEDRIDHDITTAATLLPGRRACAEPVARENGVVAGPAVAEAVFRHVVGTDLDTSDRLRLTEAHLVAQTGVDSVAVGELTHSAQVLDISMRLLDAADLPEAGGAR
jgi:nicotinate-nucleotide pyrophosphorylase (carboxylating)